MESAIGVGEWRRVPVPNQSCGITVHRLLRENVEMPLRAITRVARRSIRWHEDGPLDTRASKCARDECEQGPAAAVPA